MFALFLEDFVNKSAETNIEIEKKKMEPQESFNIHSAIQHIHPYSKTHEYMLCKWQDIDFIRCKKLHNISR